VIFKCFEPGTHAHKTIRHWKSCLTGSIIQLINDDEDVYTPADVVRILSGKQCLHKSHVTIQFAWPTETATSSEGVPTLQFDQLNVIAHHLPAINTGEIIWHDPLTWPPVEDESIRLATMKGLALPKLARRKAKTME
jgi:hypothetical protein